ncbi:hypothetical protein NYP18_14415 [Corynebacterium sp. YIM 101645]|uniref:Beta-lactamase n=1 Tax=Corynebacterium lemuris TaxID=1859292 RepID=A0ABT2G008_9CORY|nr:hypothetical protein [Corynebacterium lemuris]MCS5480835.1 hypothetical protein [Corynebacterium lemuris]
MNRWFPAAMVAVMGAGLMTGCVTEVGTLEAQLEEVTSSDHLTAEELHGELRKLIQEVNEEHGGRIGIAVATGDGVVRAGLSGHSWAWSTIKVPVALAADARGLAEEELVQASISQSDNDAAYLLSLLIDNDHDGLPHVPELAEWPGETEWSLSEQAQFAAGLPCTDTVGTTYGAMGEIVDWQQVGLSQIPGARFKAGWGQDTDTVYTLRQLGTAPVDTGVVGLAVITHPDDGTHATAEEILDEVGLGLRELIDARSISPAVSCRG